MDKYSSVRAAVVHAAPVFMNHDATVEKAIGLIKEAASEGARIIAFPEAFIPGFPYWINLYPVISQVDLHCELHSESLDPEGDAIVELQGACKEASVYAVVGANIRHGGTICNCQIFFSPKEILGIRRKLVPTCAERTVYGMGDGSDLQVHDTEIGRIGGLICWEHTMNLSRHALILTGEQLHVASWIALSSLRGFEVADEQTKVMVRNHAITGQLFVLSSMSPCSSEIINWMDRCLGPNEYQSTGGGWSGIIHPMGTVLAETGGSDDHIIYANLDFKDLQRMKFFCDAAGHYSRPDILHLSIDDTRHSSLVKRRNQSNIDETTKKVVRNNKDKSESKVGAGE